MGFKCGIIGLPNVGKSTLFNALTESNKAEAANYPFATIEPNVGRVAVPDKRLNTLSKIASSKNIIPTYMDFVDIAGLVKGASSGEGLGNKFLSHIREVDAVAHVIRCFEDENITHVSNSIDPVKDIETINTELMLADLETLENKFHTLKKKTKNGDKQSKIEIDLIDKLIKILNENKFINESSWSQEENNIINSFNLITTKPMLYICNVDEKSIINGNELTAKVKKIALNEKNQFVLVSAFIESQITEFENNQDKLAMLKELNLNETTLNKVIYSGYNLLDLITFFTCGPKETRAWTIPVNTRAIKAAGKIHSDFEKGFIRADTIDYNDYINFNGEQNCKDAGKLRQEGKDYIVKDGDILHFLFNV
tara:strand:- start:58 stop:1158 length:1101 start_codon:yes stop_codon:yes gene_type:complete